MGAPTLAREETAAGAGPPAGGEGEEARRARVRDWFLGRSSVVRDLGGSLSAQTYREAYGGLPRAAWLLALLELVNRSGMMVLFFFTLYMTRKLGFTVVQAGSVMSAYGVGSMVGTYLGGRLCDRLGAYHVQKLSLGGSAVLLVVLQLAAQPVAAGGADARRSPPSATRCTRRARRRRPRCARPSCGRRASPCTGSPAILASASVRWSAALSPCWTTGGCSGWTG